MADLDGSPEVHMHHAAEAEQYRMLDLKRV
ncbi:MAG: hypothetical protein MK074_03305 [Phycisphaerales bacterium]|nr:hypothetical protein [Phycisphaerales bacterium]